MYVCMYVCIYVSIYLCMNVGVIKLSLHNINFTKKNDYSSSVVHEVVVLV